MTKKNKVYIHINHELSSFSNYAKQIFNKQNNSDYQIRFKTNEVLYLHKTILSYKSKYFETLFDNNEFIENKQSYIELDEDYTLFYKVCYFIYHNKIKYDNYDEFFEVLILCQKYEIEINLYIRLQSIYLILLIIWIEKDQENREKYFDVLFKECVITPKILSLYGTTFPWITKQHSFLTKYYYLRDTFSPSEYVYFPVTDYIKICFKNLSDYSSIDNHNLKSANIHYLGVDNNIYLNRSTFNFNKQLKQFRMTKDKFNYTLYDETMTIKESETIDISKKENETIFFEIFKIHEKGYYLRSSLSSEFNIEDYKLFDHTNNMIYVTFVYYNIHSINYDIEKGSPKKKVKK